MDEPIKLTQLDANQIPRYSYDEENRAVRVSIVNGTSDFQAPVQKIQQAGASRIEYITVPTVERIEVPVIIKELELKTIEIPVISVKTEVQIVEVPFYIREIEYKTIEIEKPVYITEIKTVEIPLIVKEKELVFVDKVNYKMFLIFHAITLGLIVLSKFLK